MFHLLEDTQCSLSERSWQESDRHRSGYMLSQVEALLGNIPKLFAGTQVSGNCGGAAIKAGIEALKVRSLLLKGNYIVGKAGCILHIYLQPTQELMRRWQCSGTCATPLPNDQFLNVVY
jgi:hypothetical protein